MSIKFWNTASRTADPEALASLQAAGLSPLCARVLSARGVRSLEEIQSLYGEKDTLFDPFLLRDMDRAVERIRLAMESGELIVVYGDYDCDGVTSTALLYSYLESSGRQCDLLYPRPGGGGLWPQYRSHRLSAQCPGVGLIITVDNGISAHEEIAFANSLGVDVVVTDHHQPREDPARCRGGGGPPSAGLSQPVQGAVRGGVAFKLVCALEGDDGMRCSSMYGDLAALGTIADVMPLTG
ncbi:MAG: DHH family phosphoesterase [Acutalibacteraceae bacterium]